MPLLDRPSAMSASTSRSRGERPPQRVLDAARGEQFLHDSGVDDRGPLRLAAPADDVEAVPGEQAGQPLPQQHVVVSDQHPAAALRRGHEDRVRRRPCRTPDQRCAAPGRLPSP
jgi:hypothetical protein